ncbi:right-handed parallel beta-helix repeat-containing protein [candidate division KSB1 bacterium]|nr:right-handed parallel beta-helix repeat-containing protein [candidate division KSB1 bacterium]
MLKIIDVSTPASPNVRDPWKNPAIVGDMCIARNQLYVASLAESKIYSYNLSTGIPVFLDDINVPCNQVVSHGDYLYVTDLDRNFRIFDISNPSNPLEKGIYTASKTVQKMCVQDHTAFVLHSTYNGTEHKLEIVNVQDPEIPVHIRDIGLPGPGIDLFVPDNQTSPVYVVYYNPNTTKGALQVVDVTNPGKPVLLGKITTAGKPTSIWVDGTLAFVASLSVDNADWFLEAFDISDPDNPVLRASTGGSGEPIWDVIVIDGVIFATFPNYGIRSFEIEATMGKGIAKNQQLGSFTEGVFSLAMKSLMNMVKIYLNNEQCLFANTGGTSYGHNYIYGDKGLLQIKVPKKPVVTQAVLMLSKESGEDKMICPINYPSIVPIGTFTLNAYMKDWQIDKVTFATLGNGRMKELYRLVHNQRPRLSTNRGIKEGITFVESAVNDSLVKFEFSINEQLKEGEVLTMNFYYEFFFPSHSQEHFMPCPLDEVKMYAVSINMDQVSASPVEPADIVMKLPVDETFTSPWTIIACVQNINKKIGFNWIGAAVNSEKTTEKDTCEVCAGIYGEKVVIVKSELTIRSKEGAEKTSVIGDERFRNIEVFNIIQNTHSIILQGFCIRSGNYGVVIGGDNCLIGVPDNVKEEQLKLFRNVISGNYKAGIIIYGRHNKIRGNYIGTNIEGTESIGNGVGIVVGGNENTIGGSIYQYRNVISGNISYGIKLDYNNIKNMILGNFIGTKSSGNEVLKNHGDGILITSSSSNRIGGILPEEGNLISGNGGSGVTILGPGNSDNWIIGNIIGRDKSGEKIIPNDGHGIYVKKATRTRISSNIIYANNKPWLTMMEWAGIRLLEADEIRILRNHVRKGDFGLFIENSKQVGLMSNHLDGTYTNFKDKNSKYVNLKGNIIDLSIGLNTGIHMTGTSGIIEGNLISDNTGSGIHLEEGSEVRVAQNNIFDNTEFGLNNSGPSFTTDASGNWWGNASGPGSNDVGGNVNAVPWLTEPVSLVAFALEDTVYMPEGVMDSTFSVYFQNLLNPDDSVNVTLSDTQGWLTGGLDYHVAFRDSVGGEGLVQISLPGALVQGTANVVHIDAVSLTDPKTTASDSFLVLVYSPQLANIRILPDSATVSPGDTIRFIAFGRDLYNRNIFLIPVWSTTGGTIDSAGTFIAGNVEGIYRVTATDSVSQIQGEAVVIIRTETGTNARVGYIPRNFCLYQNFPNPYNPETTVRFDVKERVRVVLKMYDVLGREVLTLADRFYNPGRYEIMVYTDLLPSGIYFYRIRMGGFTDIKKMVTLK